MEKKTSWRIGIIALLCCVLVLCAVWAAVRSGEPADQPAAAADTLAEQDNNESTAADASSESLTERDRGWISDIRFLQQTFTDEHPAPFWLLPQEDFDRQIDELIEQVPKLSDLEIGMELQRIVAQIGDQHSHVYFFVELSAYPFYFYLNDDGSVYIYQCSFVDDSKQTYSLDYYEVVQINGVDIQYIVNQLKELCSSAANEYSHLYEVPALLLYRDVLKAVGVPCDGETDTFTLLDEQRRTFEIELPPEGGETLLPWQRINFTQPADGMALADFVGEDHQNNREIFAVPLYLQNQQTGFWYQYLDDEKALYFALNSFSKKLDDETFLQDMFSVATQNMADLFIIDLRSNQGGSNNIREYLLENITARSWLRGKTYVLTGANSFSASVLCAQGLREQFDAVLVGMPTGGTPWGFGRDGDKSNHVLPYSGIAFSCGSVYYVGEKYYYGQKFNSPQFAMANFFPPLSNNTVMPDVYISTDIQDLAEGRDPALEWVLAQ